MLWSLIAIMCISLSITFIYGVGAIVAVFHDVLIAIGLFQFCGITPGFNWKSIRYGRCAAHSVGLSVNDTVVIFDRIRENQKYSKVGPYQVINKH